MPFIHLNIFKSNILIEIKDLKELKWPSMMWSPLNTRDKSKYCEFYRDHGHTTATCKALDCKIKSGLPGAYVS